MLIVIHQTKLFRHACIEASTPIIAQRSYKQKMIYAVGSNYLINPKQQLSTTGS